MSLRIRSGDTIQELTPKWEIDGKQLNLQLEPIGDTSPLFLLKYDLPVARADESFENYQIFLLKNRFYSKEDNIFSIELGATAIDDTGQKKPLSAGWIFPITLFNTSNVFPNVTERKYTQLLRFVFISFIKLAQASDIPNVPFLLSNSYASTLKASDFYDPETLVWIFFCPDYPARPFDVHNYFPSLYNYGLVPILSEGDFSSIEQSDYFPNHFNSKTPFSTIVVEKIASPLQSENYIQKLFAETLKQKLDAVSRFVLLYQVVELLINKIGIFQFKQKTDFYRTSLVRLSKARIENKSFKNIKDALNVVKSSMDEYIGDVSTEEKRIGILFTNAALKSESHQEFINACLSINSIVGNNLHEHLYALRNKVVHYYHDLFTDSSNDITITLENVNYRFELLIVDLLLRFEY